MTKVKCNVCMNNEGKRCSFKKSDVKPNKSRVCELFTFDEGKVKVHVSPKVIKFGYAEEQEAKRLRKEARLQASQTESTEAIRSEYTPSVSNPLTGDLSRFTTTASE